MTTVKRSPIPGYLITLVFVSLALVQSQEILAREFNGVSFAEESDIAGEPGQLVGVGVREKFFIDVYYGGLYLQHPTHAAAEVVASDQRKQVLLHVVYKQVDSEQWVQGWKEGFQKNTPNISGELQAKIDQFLSYFTMPVKKGEEVVLSYVPGTGTTVTIKGQPQGTISGRDFMIALWNIWFGPHPASGTLMKGMLGR